MQHEIMFFGCSYTDTKSNYVDADKMYPAILAKHFKKTEKNFAKQGCGNYRSFDILSKTDLVNDSILIFQITELSRIQWYDTSIKDINLNQSKDRCLLHVYNDRFLIHELIRNLNLLVKLCRASNIKLVIWNIARFFDHDLDTFFENELSKYPEYVYLDNSLDGPDTYRVDNGRDGEGKEIGLGHPGPLSHQIIAKKLIAKYNQLYSFWD